VIVILLYFDDVVLHSILGAGLRKFEFCSSSSLEANLAMTKIMIFGCNKKKYKPTCTLPEQGPN
jgi:hypothetical protein